MPLNIKSPEADELARRLAKKTGRNLTGAVIYALREQLRQEEGWVCAPDLAEELLEIGRHCAALPDIDRRGADEIPGFDEHGIWA
ncbi:MAG: type II toxin-antitoxin system VapB family antitoxin [Bryobacteraceae bacterium]